MPQLGISCMLSYVTGIDDIAMSWVANIVRGRVSHLCRQPSKVVLRALQVQAESEGEKKLAEILKRSFSASQIAVRDISGGCGAMYEIFVESEDFRGKRQVHQHRLINQALGDEVKQMHGLRIFTAIPGENKG